MGKPPDSTPPQGLTITAPPRPVLPAHSRGEEATTATDPIETHGPDRYEMGDEHARGGLGRILNARDRQLDREVVVKELLHPSRDAEHRFLSEARTTARLEHPGIVPVHEAGRRSDGSPFYVMKKVAGRPLKECIAECESLAQRLGLLPHVIAVADAITYAHSKRVIHRDLKSANVIVGEFGETIVIDWGLAKDLSRPRGPRQPAGLSPATVEQGRTIAGQVLGTPAYMPPEQARGEDVDERADIYALGALLYQVITRAAPYDGATSDEVLERVRSEPPVRLKDREPRAPDDLAAIVERAMAREPAARYGTARNLAEDLRRYQTGQLVAARNYGVIERVGRWMARHRTLSVSAIAVLVVAFASGVWALRREQALRKQEQSARREAEDERDRTAAEKARADQQSLALLEQQAHAELAAGQPFRAAVLFNEAYQRGRETFGLKLGLGEAMRDVERLRATLGGHEAWVSSATYSPDGHRVVTASWDMTARVWDARTGTEMKVLRGHSGPVVAANYSPDGSQIVTASWDATARIWDVHSGAQLLLLRGHEAEILSATYSPDGLRIVTASGDTTARIWDAHRATTRRILRGHSGAVKHASFSPDGGQIVTASSDGTVRIWDARTGSVLRVLSGHDAPVFSAAYSPDGAKIVTGSSDRTARTWDARTGAALAMFRGHLAGVSSAMFSPDGTHVLTAGSDKTAQIWAPETGIALNVLRGHQASITSAAYSPSGTQVVTSGYDNAGRIWTSRTRLVDRIAGHAGQVVVCRLSPDGTRLLSWSGEGIAQLHDVRTEALVWRRAARIPWAATFTPDGTRIVASDYAGTVPIVLSAKTGDIEFELRGHTGLVFGIDVSPDGRSIATASHDGTVRFWDAQTGDQLGESIPIDPPAGPPGVLGISFSPNGQRFVTAGFSGTLGIWDTGARALLRTLPGHSGAVSSAVYSPDGQRILSSGWDDQVVKVWDAETGDLLATFEGHTGRVFAASWSPDGNVIATAGQDERALFWDSTSGEPLYELGGPVFSASFSPDGSMVAVGGFSGYARLLRLETRSTEELNAALAGKVDWAYMDGKLVKLTRDRSVAPPAPVPSPATTSRSRASTK